MQEEAIAQLFYRALIKTEEQAGPASERIGRLHHLLLQLFVERTQRERLHFSTLFARMSYAFQQHQVPRSQQFHLHHFRKEARALLDGRRVDDPEELYRYGLGALAGAVQAFYGVPLPEELQSAAQTLPSRSRETIEIRSFYGDLPVLLVGEDPERHQLLACREASPEHTFRVQFNLADRNDYLAPSLRALRAAMSWPVTAHLLDVEVDAAGLYRPAGLVIEPDFLVDVSAISECFKPEGADPVWYLLKKFLPFQTTKYLLLGNIANFFLDELMSNPQATFRETFERVFHLNPLGFSLLPDREVREIMDRSQRHFLSLKQVLARDFPEKGIQAEESFLEPTFYSNRYGLQGRLDVFHQGPDSTAIVELKSGKAFRPNIHGISSSHFTQTLLYDLLIRSTFSEKLDPLNFILYSAQEVDQLKYAPRVKAQQQEALQLRNLLVAAEYCLADAFAHEGAPPLEDSAAARLLLRIRPESYPQSSGFGRSDLEHFSSVLHQLRPLEWKYFLAYSGFIAREHRLAKTGKPGEGRNLGQAGLWRCTWAEKNEAYELLGHLRLVDNRAGEADPLLSFERQAEQTNPLANFRRGDIAVLYPAQAQGEAPLRQQLFKCTITEIGPERVQVRLRSPQFNQKIFQDYPHWNLEHDLLDGSFLSLYRSLFGFAGGAPARRALLLGERQPRPGKEGPPIDYPGMTALQRDTLRRILAAEDYFLLWGPPGTGKTSVLLRYLVEWLLRNTQENLLLLAYTNRAVDEICESLEQIGPDIRDQYLRIGSSYSTDAAYVGQLLDAKIAQLRNRKEIHAMLARHRIFVGTVSSFAGKQELLQLKPFQRVIVDEASQILEPMLAGLLVQFERFVLIGDHQQLPAVVVQDEHSSAVSDPELTRLGLTNMRNSLFERLYKRCQEQGWDWAYGRLSQQGRMHSEIMLFPNRFFYQDHLCTLPPEADPLARQVSPLALQLPSDASELERQIATRRFLFLPVQGDGNGASDKTNREEAVAIAELIEAFRRVYEFNDRSLDLRQIGIITPYRAQIAQIQEVLSQRGLHFTGLTIDTVERYQGGARDIILLSLCTNSAWQLDTLISRSEEGVDRKLNVALTRAREHVVVLGNPEFLAADPTYRELMEMGRKGGKG